MSGAWTGGQQGTAAVQLGHTELAVRLGGVYALERIAVDSERDHPTVVEVLSAFVREESRKKAAARAGQGTAQLAADTDTPAPESDASPRPATDIQAALTVLGRLPQRPEIPRADLSEAQLSGAGLAEADLSGARLPGANLSHASLEGVNLFGAGSTRRTCPAPNSGRRTCGTQAASCRHSWTPPTAVRALGSRTSCGDRTAGRPEGDRIARAPRLARLKGCRIPHAG
jgi:pentapeptide repeat protein